MGLTTILIWVAIVIFWSLKAASEQKKRTQREVLPTDEADERVAAPIPTQAEARHVRRTAEQKVRRSRREEEMPIEPFGGGESAVTSETSDCDTSVIGGDRSATARLYAEPAAADSEQARFAATNSPLDEPFDLRRAVIYSEILKPKFKA